jgi:hypothetical protein
MEVSELRSKLVSNYKSELDFILKLKNEDNVEFLESRSWDFTGELPDDVLIPIDDVITEISNRLDKLESLTEMTIDEVQGYNY